MASIRTHSKKHTLRGVLISFLLALSQFGQFFILASVFYKTAYWKDEYDLHMDKMYMSLFAMFYGIYGAGMANHFLGDFGKAKKANKK